MDSAFRGTRAERRRLLLLKLLRLLKLLDRLGGDGGLLDEVALPARGTKGFDVAEDPLAAATASGFGFGRVGGGGARRFF